MNLHTSAHLGIPKYRSIDDRHSSSHLCNINATIKPFIICHLYFFVRYRLLRIGCFLLHLLITSTRAFLCSSVLLHHNAPP
ncbi:uncharacterized protein K489DRAFT_52560 [Dissoconium aciculare CBS 342.82]|uniref:Uncharacterized protein n=1 Tax=Dissoconium aciculare CBS 342.82 TaxID=1314786 RepID=A0A6J3LYB5_9PEZI|nr:uncharacterized protein K489DRAFT_52560 [Dissoconium aciculare CBS 342.82]KAF1820299.1 hypothetical protein K489DRAFT_52560 [Dissoconium aciculare CBS 342.82]